MSEGDARCVLANPHARQARQLRQFAWATLRALRSHGKSIFPSDLRSTCSPGSPVPLAQLTGGPANTHGPRPARPFFTGNVAGEGAK